MSDHVDLPRRALLAAPAVLAMAGSTAACAEPAPERRGETSDTLVAYVTRSGNTRVIAGTVQRALGAALFEIRPARAYPEDYEAHVEQARRENEREAKPTLAVTVPDIGRYRTVYLGFPIWGGTSPPTVRSFLDAHDLRGKTVRPFITHGGYGVGDSLSVLKAHAPGAEIAAPFILEADQERRTLNQVNGWLDGIGAA